MCRLHIISTRACWLSAEENFSGCFRLFLTPFSTHVSPSADDVEEVVFAVGEIDDALVDGFGGSLGGEVFLVNANPAETADGEPNGRWRIAGIIAAGGGRGGGVVIEGEV